MKSPLSCQAEAHDWKRRYEQLREQVLAGNSMIAADCRGLTVLITRGMAAWRRAWQEPLCCPVTSAPLKAEALPVSLPTHSWQEEATRLLVNMALSQLRRTPACNR